MILSELLINLLYIGVYVLGEAIGWLGGIMIVMAFIDSIISILQILRK